MLFMVPATCGTTVKNPPCALLSSGPLSPMRPVSACVIVIAPGDVPAPRLLPRLPSRVPAMSADACLLGGVSRRKPSNSKSICSGLAPFRGHATTKTRRRRWAKAKYWASSVRHAIALSGPTVTPAAGHVGMCRLPRLSQRQYFELFPTGGGGAGFRREVTPRKATEETPEGVVVH